MYDNTKIGGMLGSSTPIPLRTLKGWLFQQSWITQNPGEQLHPARWTSISKGQVWNPPPSGLKNPWYTDRWHGEGSYY